MTRTPVRLLSRYLLTGRIPSQGCLLSHPRVPISESESPHAKQSARSRSLQTSTASHPQPLPLRKQINQESKRARKDSKKSKSNNQTVPGWELTVGIEIHAQLNSAKKLFSPSSTTPSSDPNSRLSPFDLALPGSQPLFQPAVLVPALRAATVLNCAIQPESSFDRKHYFWWDQPSGYQITQYYRPLAKDGYVTLNRRDGIAEEDGEEVRVGIKQVQLEQDTAKTLAVGSGEMWLDFNRVGVPLVEIITLPVIRHPRTAAAVVRKIQLLLSGVDACVLGMEAGGLRADINVSVRREAEPSGLLGKRTEIKNLNTIKSVEDAIIAERDRQIRELEAGGVIAGETRGWTVGATETHRIRGKEGEVDYRYMPDPDIPPLRVGEELVSYVRDTLATSPDAELDGLMGIYGLTAKDAISLVALDGGARVEYFYNVVEDLQTRLAKAGQTVDLDDLGKFVGNWILHELGRLTSEKMVLNTGNVVDLTFTPDGKCEKIPVNDLAELLFHLHLRKITGKVAKELLVLLFQGELMQHGSVADAIEAKGLWFQDLPMEEYTALADKTLEEETKVVDELVSSERMPMGKLMFLVGKMVRQGPRGRVDAKMAEGVLLKKINVLRQPRQ